MSNVRKMHVLNEEEMARMRDQQLREYVPEIRTLSILKSELDDLLHNKQMTDEERLSLVNRAQLRYESLKDQVATQSSSKAATPAAAATAPVATTADAADQPGAHPDEGVLSGMNDEEMRAQATEIMNFIDENRNVVNYNPKSKQLIINGKMIKSSNLTRILHYMLDQSGQATRPSGYVTFLHTLNAANFPIDLISNPYAKTIKELPAKTQERLTPFRYTNKKRTKSQNTSLEGHGKVKRPRILHVY